MYSQCAAEDPLVILEKIREARERWRKQYPESKALDRHASEGNFTRYGNELLEEGGPKGNDLLVYLVLRSFTFVDNACFPSVAEIARRSGLSRRTVVRSLNRLEDAGHIDRENRQGGRKPGGGNRTTVYHLNSDSRLFPDRSKKRAIQGAERRQLGIE